MRYSPADADVRRPPLAELNLVTGIAAILTYPLDVEIVEMEEREEKEKQDALKKEHERRSPSEMS